MNPLIRQMFPFFALIMVAGAVAYALSFGQLPPADFSFQNGDQPQTLDPQIATGQPEHRLVNALYEGLMREMPVGEPGPDGMVKMKADYGVAQSFDLSEDGRTYTFHLRPEAKWSNGSPVTAHDFVWSWRRMLHPELAARYAYQLANYLVGGKAYNEGMAEVGDHVEVELDDRPVRGQQYPSGTILRGVLVHLDRPPQPTISKSADDDEKAKILAAWRSKWIYVVDCKGSGEGAVDWDSPGELRAFTDKSPEADITYKDRKYKIEHCLHTLPDFATTVGVKALDDRTLQVDLINSPPYFPSLTAFYSLFPVNRQCIETHGTPEWTKAENFVGNGPYTLEFKRIRDRVRLIKNDHYWAADKVTVKRIDALAVSSSTTALNMYLNGQCDWITDPPSTIVDDLKKRPDFITGPQLSIYFYRLNTTRKPLDDLRSAGLNMAIDKHSIVNNVTKLGQVPARSVVPPYLEGYEPAYGDEYDIEKAQQLLAEAGYPAGRGMPKIEVLFNTSDNHRMIAEVIERNWRQIGVNVELKNLEWGSYLDAQHNLTYTVARAGWVADYDDPNTFLDMWLTGGGQNETGWGSPEYDDLIKQAAMEPDTRKRMQMLHDAEQILMNEMPIIPIYYYVSKNMVKPYVKHLHANVLDQHPLHILEIEPH